MTMSADLTLIRRRRAEIEAEINRLQARVQELQADFRDLAVAERVLVKLGGESGGQDRPRVEQPAPRSGGGKPDGTPSVTEMIVMVLDEAQTRMGLRGLEPKDMATRIAGLWWPDVRPDDVNGIAWRMWKRGQLVKDGSVYMLPKKEEATGDLISRSAPAASANPAEATAQGREDGPGGGT